MNTRPIESVISELEQQTHRRFLKSHLSYDLLPHISGVTYITVGRDPRDVGLSWMHHLDNVVNLIGSHPGVKRQREDRLPHLLRHWQGRPA